jgi:hypothetical protein
MCSLLPMTVGSRPATFDPNYSSSGTGYALFSFDGSWARRESKDAIFSTVGDFLSNECPAIRVPLGCSSHTHGAEGK